MRPRTSALDDLLKKHKLTSQDDGEKKFEFSAFERVMTEMTNSSTGIGGILSAMVYQIEQDNAKEQIKAAGASQPVTAGAGAQSMHGDE